MRDMRNRSGEWTEFEAAIYYAVTLNRDVPDKIYYSRRVSIAQEMIEMFDLAVWELRERMKGFSSYGQATSQ